MSQIPNIASSVAQGALQQSQSAKAIDAERQKAGRFTLKMRKLQEAELESVEDSYEVSDDVLKVDEEEREAGRDSRDTRRPDSDRKDGDPPHVDIVA
jgi:hypothetical protein